MAAQTLVIGGAGFIGRRVVKALLARGRRVLVAGRRPGSAVELPKAAAYIQFDYNEQHGLDELFRQCDAIVDLAYAAPPRADFSDPFEDFRRNFFPGVGLLVTAVNAKWRGRLLVVSSGGTVYGVAKSLPLKEDSAVAPVSPYGITKLAIERYADMYFRLSGLDVVVVRPANAYGLGQQPFTGQGFVATAMGCVARRQPVTVFGETGTIRDYVHVNDVAEAISAALDSGRSGGVYNIGTGEGRTNMDVLQSLSSIVAPDGFAVNAINEPVRGFDVPANVLDSGKLMLECGWCPRVNFGEGLGEMWLDIKQKYGR